MEMPEMSASSTTKRRRDSSSGGEGRSSGKMMKQKARRRSSFSAKRLSITTPFTDLPSSDIIDKERPKSSSQSTETSCTVELVSDSQDANLKETLTDEDFDRTQVERCTVELVSDSQDANLKETLTDEDFDRTQVERLLLESNSWDEHLKESEEKAAAAKTNFQEQLTLCKEDLCAESQVLVQELIGQPPDYSAILEKVYDQANRAVLMVEDICKVVELLDQVAEKCDRLLQDRGQNLSEISMPNMDTPRTQLKERLTTPKSQ